MSGGSVYDYLHKKRGSFKLPSLLKVAMDISKGMSYLHQNNIIHRDLKAANLLMDENGVSDLVSFYPFFKIFFSKAVSIFLDFNKDTQFLFLLMYLVLVQIFHKTDVYN